MKKDLEAQGNKPLDPQQSPPHPARIPGGIMLVLLGVSGLLNRFLITYINYLLIYLFGTLYFLIYIMLIIAGVLIVFKKENPLGEWNVSTTGVAVLLFTITLLASYLLYKQDIIRTNYPALSFKTINPIIKEHALNGKTLKDMNLSDGYLPFGFYGGGLLGDTVLTILLMFLSYPVALTFIILLFILGLVLLFWYFIKANFKKIKLSWAGRKEKKAFFEDASSLERHSSKPAYRPLASPIKESKAVPIDVEEQELAIPTNTRELENKYGLKRAVYVDTNVQEVKVTTAQPLPTKDPVIYPPHESEEKAELGSIFDAEYVAEPLLDDEPYQNELETTYREPTVAPSYQAPPVQKAKPLAQPVSKPQVSPVKKYVYPSLDLLSEYSDTDFIAKNKSLAEERLRTINETLASFNVGASAISYTIGPTVTQFDIQMNHNESVNAVEKVVRDVSIRLNGVRARFEPIVAGRSTSGLEIANQETAIVGFKECLKGLPEPTSVKTRLLIPFGKNVAGKVVSARLDEAPHILVAGTTGSGKSIFIHSIIMTLIMRNRPDELRLMIIDPKRIDMGKYKDMPHLLCPIITDYDEAKVAMDKLVAEMENRYDLLEETGASSVSEFNEIAEMEGYEKMPHIVVIIDEYADLVGAVKDIATPVVRVAQKSRAAGIHLVISTQRPSVDVITGVIKANLPTRVALMVSSPTDSMTILNRGGAEELLGKGDLLVESPLISRQGLTRLQGSYVDNKEIRQVVNFLKEHYPTNYKQEFLDLKERSAAGADFGGLIVEKDERYEEIKEWVLTQDYISINRIQTIFSMGFSRASRIFNMLKDQGVVEVGGESNSARGSRVLNEDKRSPEEIRIDNNEY